MKMLTVCKTILACLLCLSFCAASAQTLDPPEYRMSHVYGFAGEFASPTATSIVIDTLANNNFNVVMPQIRKNGDAYYNSSYEPYATDVAAGYDPLGDIISKAHARDIEIYGWIVTYRIWGKGKVAPANHIWTLHPEWALIDNAGRNYVGSYHNLDPGIPGVEEYIVNLVKDIVTKYPDLDGINFDYIRYDSTAYGYNPISKARFKAESGVDPPTSTSSPDWASWSEWKRRQITDLVKRCYLEAIHINPGIKMSADTIGWMGGDPVLDFTATRGYRDVCQDSKGWMEQHFLDINMLMNYKRDWTRMLADVGYRYNGYAFGNQSADYFLWSDYLTQLQDSSGRHCVDSCGGYMNITQGTQNQWGYDRAHGIGLGIFRYGFSTGKEDPAAPGLPVMSGSSVVQGTESTFYSTIKSTMFPNPAPVPDMPWKSAPTKGYLFGQVTNAHLQDDPVYGGWMYNIPVTATDADGYVHTAITDGTGTYGFIDLEAGTYRISINLDGFVPIQDYPVTVTAGLATKQNLQVMPILPLEIAITWPTSDPNYLTQGSQVTIGGTIVGNEGGKTVKWVSNRGGAGNCTLSGTNWISGPISLQQGVNVITVTAGDAAVNSDRDTITVTYEPPLCVSPTGNDANDGSTWALAKKTIHAGLEASASGKHVWVAAGNYNERINLKQNVHLYGGFAGTETDLSQRNIAANTTTIAGGPSGSIVTCVNMTTGHPTMDGFTITNGFALDGGGIYIDAASPTIRNNVITGNLAFDYGAGIYCHNGSPIIANNTITANASDWLGGGIFCASTYTISSPTITNNLIAGNNAYRYGGGIYCDFSSPTITNNTIANNQASANGGAIYAWDDASPVLSNNIIANNSSGVCQSSGSPSLRNNCLYGNTTYDYSGLSAGAGDIASNPLFVNSASGDYHITASSPCVNTGWNSAPGMTQTDMDGAPRIVGGVVDIGADESAPLPISISEAKKKEPATSIYLHGQIVTATFPDFFYVEAPNRSSGIRVDKTAHGLIPGVSVSVFGTVNTDSTGESHIDNAAVVNTGYGRVDPFALANRALGGGGMFFNPATGAGQDGVSGYQWVKSGDTWAQQMMDAAGLNNIGLLITTFGQVTFFENGSFYVDDGSGLDDRSGHLGVKIIGSVPHATPIGKLVKVTGISSCYTAGATSTDLYRKVLATEVVVLQ